MDGRMKNHTRQAIVMTGRIATATKLRVRCLLRGTGDFIASLHNNEFTVSDDLHIDRDRLYIAKGIEPDFSLQPVKLDD